MGKAKSIFVQPSLLKIAKNTKKKEENKTSTYIKKIHINLPIY
jgi:hypothetical protein